MTSHFTIHNQSYSPCTYSWLKYTIWIDLWIYSSILFWAREEMMEFS